VIVNIRAPPAGAKKMPLTRGELIRKLFPNLDAYTAGERERWRMTTAHWDQNVIEIDLKAAHPGVYYPMLPAIERCTQAATREPDRYLAGLTRSPPLGRVLIRGPADRLSPRSHKTQSAGSTSLVAQSGST
jgi:hypothetical protein